MARLGKNGLGVVICLITYLKLFPKKLYELAQSYKLAPYELAQQPCLLPDKLFIYTSDYILTQIFTSHCNFGLFKRRIVRW